MGNVQKLKFDHAEKRYKHKPKCVLKNMIYKFSETLKYKWIILSQSELLAINKKKNNLWIVPFQQTLKRKGRMILGFWQKTKNAVEHEGDRNTNCSKWIENGP